jgi:hypothetical protein
LHRRHNQLLPRQHEDQEEKSKLEADQDITSRLRDKEKEKNLVEIDKIGDFRRATSFGLNHHMMRFPRVARFRKQQTDRHTSSFKEISISRLNMEKSRDRNF